MLKLMSRRLRTAEEGFTLIELLVVVAIIALLATFAAPKLFEAINKAKRTPGQAAMNTISSALERYYMEENTYPLAADVEANLTKGYLKRGTQFYNGFDKGYIYITDDAGSFYILIDPKNEPVGVGELTVTCGAGNAETLDVTGEAITFVETAAITAADVAANACVVSGATATDPDEAPTVITN